MTFNTQIAVAIEKHPRTDAPGWVEDIRDDAPKNEKDAEPNLLLGFLHRCRVTFQTLFTPDAGGETVPVGMAVPLILVGWKVKRRGPGIQLVPATRPFIVKDARGDDIKLNERTMKFDDEDQYQAILRGLCDQNEIGTAWAKSDQVLEQRIARFERVQFAPVIATASPVAAGATTLTVEQQVANALQLITQGDQTKIALVSAALGLSTTAGAAPPAVTGAPNVPMISGGVIVGA